MADSEHSFPLATVIWFESLEFMSLSYGYDMVLSRPGTQLTMTTISPSTGERCAGITIPAGLKHPDDGIPA
jgi:hypothetical protein